MRWTILFLCIFVRMRNQRYFYGFSIHKIRKLIETGQYFYDVVENNLICIGFASLRPGSNVELYMCRT